VSFFNLRFYTHQLLNLGCAAVELDGSFTLSDSGSEEDKDAAIAPPQPPSQPIPPQSPLARPPRNPTTQSAGYPHANSPITPSRPPSRPHSNTYARPSSSTFSAETPFWYHHASSLQSPPPIVTPSSPSVSSLHGSLSHMSFRKAAPLQKGKRVAWVVFRGHKCGVFTNW